MRFAHTFPEDCHVEYIKPKDDSEICLLEKIDHIISVHFYGGVLNFITKVENYTDGADGCDGRDNIVDGEPYYGVEFIKDLETGDVRIYVKLFLVNVDGDYVVYDILGGKETVAVMEDSYQLIYKYKVSKNFFDNVLTIISSYSEAETRPNKGACDVMNDGKPCTYAVIADDGSVFCKEGREPFKYMTGC